MANPNGMIGANGTVAYSVSQGTGGTVIGEIVSYDFNGPDVEKVDATSLSSGTTKQPIPGMTDPGSSKVTFHYYESSLNSTFSIFTNRTSYYWTFTQPDGSYLQVQGWSSKFALKNAGADNLILCDAEITHQTLPTFTMA